MSKHDVLLFLGTTAELIKTLPVIKELKNRKICFKIITSGQGRINFSEFSYYLSNLKADISFEYKGDKSSPFKFAIWATATLLKGIFRLHTELLGKDRNVTHFVVHGDTVSSLIGAILSVIFRVKLVHIESGLRSYDFLEPFPEEISRFLISHIASIHFCPNEWSVNNLKSVGGIKINTIQNTLLDIFHFTQNVNASTKRPKANQKKYFVLVIHRQEHVIFQRELSQKILSVILDHTSKYKCCLIMHQLTSDFLSSLGSNLSQQSLKNIELVPRLPYLEFVDLLKHADFLITDGGSNREGSVLFRTSMFTLTQTNRKNEGTW